MRDGLTAVIVAEVMTLAACASSKASVSALIEFTRLPPAGEGSPEKLDPIEGRVTGAKAGERIVLFARSGVWWVQPFDDHPFTEIQSDATWRNETHPGSAYAALLVGPGYHPPPTLDALPERNNAVRAIALAESPRLSHSTAKVVQFSGYEWEIRETTGNSGGSTNHYDPSNAWTDSNGLLHLRIAKRGMDWSAAEVRLTRSLGYGSYRFVVRGLSHLEPAAAFTMSTWDDTGPPREMDIEISRWGEPESKSAQYVIQPYFVPANTFRFRVPEEVITNTLRWDAGRAAFRTTGGGAAIAEHVFTSGVPSPGNETVHMNLYVFQNKNHPLQHETEVIVEKFEYLP